MDHAECKNSVNLPVNLSLLDKMAKKEQEREDEFRLSKAATDNVMATLNAIRTIDRGNPDVRYIILEEIGNYLNGQQSIDTLADIIENRIGIFLAEQE